MIPILWGFCGWDQWGDIHRFKVHDYQDNFELREINHWFDGSSLK